MRLFRIRPKKPSPHRYARVEAGEQGGMQDIF